MKNHTKVPMPKPDDPFTSHPITLNNDWGGTSLLNGSVKKNPKDLNE